jgi:GDPmannose 4,6-dehydratase
MKKKNIFIFGVSGQDGAYLANLLINKKFKIYGFTRSLKKSNLKNLKKLSILKKINLCQYSEKKTDFIEKYILKYKPSQIYYLSGLSSVSKSFFDPLDTYKSNIIVLFKILEICRKNKSKIKIYNSASTDCFGNQKKICNENTSFQPLSPYAKSKSYAFWLVKYYRETFKVNCVNGILSNHESVLRNKNFVSKKIIDYVKKFDSKKKLIMGRTNIYRDWGWAPDFVEAIFKINTSSKRSDYIVATGKSISLNYFIKKAFSIKNIDKNFYIKNNNKHLRNKEVNKVYCDIRKIKKDIGWKPKYSIDQVIAKLINNDLL